MQDLLSRQRIDERPWVVEATDTPLWTRLPRAEDARAYRVPDGLLLVQSEDVKAVLTDARFVQWSLWALERHPQIDPRFLERRRQQLLSMEGGEHDRLRRLTVPAFSGATAQTFRGHMRATMRRIAERAAQLPAFDAVPTLCEPYPVPVICAVMGVPEGDIGFFTETARAWTSWILGGPAAVQRSMQAHEAMDAYLAPLIERRRAQPASSRDMLGLLLQAEENGDRLTREDVIRTLSGFLVGGTDTTQYALASALYLFATHPEQWAMLRAQPALARQAVDEVLRYVPVGAVQTRVSNEDVELEDGLRIAAGTKVYASLVSVNHDSRLYPQPQRFDITRAAKPMHLSFGFGRHACLGMHLARLELEEALLLLNEIFATLELDGPVAWQPPTTFQGPARLPLRVGLRARA